LEKVSVDDSGNRLLVLIQTSKPVRCFVFEKKNPPSLFVQFTDTAVYASGDPIQVGAGTQVSSLPSLFTQGSVSATGVPTDVAIQGTGFFAVQSSSGVIDYTRAGAFSVDANNFLVTSGGQQVLGYPAANGVVNTGAGIAPLQLGAGTISPPTATGNVQLTANLNAAAVVGDTFSTPVTIYDSLGASHTLTATFTNKAANEWTYSLAIPASDLRRGCRSSTSSRRSSPSSRVSDARPPRG